MVYETTFGESPCAVSLAAILNEMDSNKVTAKVGRFISQYNRCIRQISYMPDPAMRKYFGGLLMDEIKNSDVELPTKVKTHAINILIGNVRFHFFD